MSDDSPSGFDGSALSSPVVSARVLRPDVPPTVALHVFLNPSTRGPMAPDALAPDALANELQSALRQRASDTALVTSSFQDTAVRRDVRALFL